jgi:hypothetical protein
MRSGSSQGQHHQDLHGRNFGVSIFTHLRSQARDGVDELPDGVDELPDGVDELPDGVDGLPDGVDGLPDGVASNLDTLVRHTVLSNGTVSAIASAPGIQTAPGADLASGSSTVFGTDQATVATGDAVAGPVIRPRRARRILAGVITTLAGLLVLSALVAPDHLDLLTPGAFVRIPVEALLGVVVLLVLPSRARTAVAALTGVFLAVLTVVKLADMGFYSVLDRPFHPLLDWAFLGDGLDYLTTSISRTAAIGAVVGAGVLAVALLALMTLSMIRVARLVARHRQTSWRAVGVLGVVWAICAALGAQFTPGEPIAARSAAGLTYDHVRQVGKDIAGEDAFTKAIATDPFRNTPGSALLTGLRGKDVMITFIESYGRSAVEDPALAPQVDAVLDAGTSKLQAAGFSARSGWLTSPTFGGGSWLAHSTLLSGVWTDNQRHYQKLVKTDRLTLTEAFGKANWRTAAFEPGTTRAWPEGLFYGYDKIYAEHDLGYQGPHFAWAPMPDQYTLSVFQRREHAPGHAPVAAELTLVSSHAPWAPIPSMVDWNSVGDGSIYDPQPAAGFKPGDVWKSASRVRTEYGRSIQYSLNSVITFLQKYGDKNTVLVFLGDHQPASIVTGAHASHDVPITIVAHDPAVLDRISSWGWADGLKPDPKSPVWPMSDFRNRFLTAFGSQPQIAP